MAKLKAMAAAALVASASLVGCGEEKDLGAVGNAIRDSLRASADRITVRVPPSFGRPEASDLVIGEKVPVEVVPAPLPSELPLPEGAIDLDSCSPSQSSLTLPTLVPTGSSTTEVSVPVEASFRWRDRAKPAPEDTAGFEGPAAEFMTTAAVVPFDTREKVTRTVEAVVRLTAHPERVSALSACNLKPITVAVSPELELPVVPLALPTTAALFKDRDLQGPALIVVPQHLPLSTKDELLERGLRPVEEKLREAEETINDVRAFASLVTLLTQIDFLDRVLESNVVVRRATELDDLNDIDLVKRNFFENDTEAEDEFSSALFLEAGVLSDQRLLLSNDRNLGKNQGMLRLETGTQSFLVIGDLHHDSFTDRVAARMEGDGKAVVVAEPSGRRRHKVLPQFHKITTFGDEFSSTRFLTQHFPTVDLYEGNDVTQDRVCSIPVNRSATIAFNADGFGCDNDEARSAILRDLPGGVVLRFFDSAGGGTGDDRLEVRVKRPIGEKRIDSFERSFEDSDVRVVYSEDNGLDGKVSRLEMSVTRGG